MNKELVKNKFDRFKEIKKELLDNKNDEKLNQELFDIVKDLKELSLKTFSKESDFKKFLDNIGKFNNYSFNNQLLIALQKPDSKFVASFKTYKDLGYSVKSNPDSIKIIIPKEVVLVLDNRTNEIRYFNQLNEEEKQIYKDKNNNDIVYYSKKLVSFSLGTVFDITDSTMTYNEIENKLYPKLTDDNATLYIEVVEKIIKENNYKLEYKKLSDKEGYCDMNNNKIVISEELKSLSKLKVLVHELAHSLAHTNLKENYEEYKKDRSRYEVEAESISYSVCKYFNLKVADDSSLYLYNYSKNKDFKEIDNSLNTITNISMKIIKKINEKTKSLENSKDIVLTNNTIEI